MDIKKLIEIFQHIPVIGLVPIFVKAWNTIPEDKQIEIATALIMAGGKFAAQYAGGTK